MSIDGSKLHRLLPDYLREQDADVGSQARIRLGLAPLADEHAGGPLAELLDVVGEVVGRLDADIDGLYDDQFIETCAEWAAFYIGDLIGARIYHGSPAVTATVRAQVADTIKSRRRKGTLIALEILGRSMTRWPTLAEEFFERLVMAIHLDHQRGQPAASLNIADRRALADLGRPYSAAARVPSVRKMIDGGSHNIPNIGLFVWPHQSLIHEFAEPFRVGPTARRFRFDPLGVDRALFRNVEGSGFDDGRTEIRHLPYPLRIIDVADDPGGFYGANASFAIFVGSRIIPQSDILVCNLADAPAGWNSRGPANDPALTKVDPELGRFVLGDGFDPADGVRVHYHFGAFGSVGGGGYPRSDDELHAPDAQVVDDDATAIPDFDASGVIALATSRTLSVPGPLTLPPDARLVLGARSGFWPLLIGSNPLTIAGGSGSRLHVKGLRISGGTLAIEAPPGAVGLSELILEDCTLVPGLQRRADGSPSSRSAASLRVDTSGVLVRLVRCITGRIDLHPEADIEIEECIVDSPDPDRYALAYDGGDAGLATIRRATIIGAVRVTRVDEISDSLVTDARGSGTATPGLRVASLQTGCARYSFFPEGSVVPRPYRCLPFDAVGEVPMPRFSSLTYGEPGYGVLDRAVSPLIGTGGENGVEMGVFARIAAAQRLRQFQAALSEFVRFGRDAAIRVENA